MNDTNPSHKENPTHINREDDNNKETTDNAALPTRGNAPKPRSSGRGLYITAIVLGIIIVLLLALYIFLSLTRIKSSHSSVAPMPAIVQIAKN